MMRRLGAEGTRFLVFGAFNTLATYGIYCVLVGFLAPQVAYAIVFALGIALAYAGNSLFVFRAPMRWRIAGVYPGVYVLQYLANAVLIEAFTGSLGLGPRVALALSLAIVTPVSFLLNRALLGRAKR
jgi:putative flippase GtrA